MKNKILIVILAVVWIVAAGTGLNIFLDVDSSKTGGCMLGVMSSSEIRSFNSTFTSYEGVQTRTQVKALINRLIANANTYKEEPNKMPIVSYNSNGNSEDKNSNFSQTFCEVENENETENYLLYLNMVAKQLELKHEYYVIMTLGEKEMLRGITINYDRTKPVENFEFDESKEVFKAISGVKRVDIDFLISNTNSNNKANVDINSAITINNKDE